MTGDWKKIEDSENVSQTTRKILTEYKEQVKKEVNETELEFYVRRDDYKRLEYKVTKKDSSYCSYVIFATSYFSGCCGLMIASGFSVNDSKLRPNMIKLLKKLASSYGYTQLIVTHTVENGSKWIEAFKKEGFEEQSEFKNRNSGNMVKVLTYTFPYERKNNEVENIKYGE